MFIRPLDDKDQYDFFVSSVINISFLQSYQWGEFQKSLGRKILRIGIYSGNTTNVLLGTALLIKHGLPFGLSYFYCPRGPVLNDVTDSEAIKALLLYVKAISKLERAIFVRIDPFFSLNIDAQAIKQDINYIFSIQPETELSLKLNFTEKELLSNMGSKTRYNIKNAQTNNIEVKVSSGNQADINTFYDLVVGTAARHKMRVYSKEYYRGIMNAFNGCSKIYTAFVNGQALASNLLIMWGDTVTYLHGGSDFARRDLMAPYLLHWQAIQDSRKAGYKYYNFGGLGYMNDKELTGLTRFKNGFVSVGHGDGANTGIIFNYEKSFDVVYNKFWYSFYKIMRLLNKIIKKFS